VYFTTTDRPGQRNGHLHMVVVWAAHEIESIDQVFLGDDDDPLTLDVNGFSTDDKYNTPGVQFVRVIHHLGSPTQVADPLLVDEVDEWTDDHRLQALSYSYLRLRFNPDIFPEGVPNVSIVGKFAKVFDPRTSTTAYSENSALVLLDYLTGHQNDPDYDYGMRVDKTDEIDEATFIAAANICEEPITLLDETIVDRYNADGVLSTADNHIDNIKKIISSFAGRTAYTQGQWVAFAGAFDAPTVTIDTDEWLIGDISVLPKPTYDELFNAVKGVFVDKTKKYQATDFPARTNAFFQDQDNGELLFADFVFHMTTCSERAQRLAKIQLEEHRQPIVATLPCNLRALQLRIWDTVAVINDDLGWASKVFRVIRWALNPEGGIEVTIKEDASSIYDWNAGDATLFDTAPNTNLPDPTFVFPPGIPIINEVKFVSTDGTGVKVKAEISWAASENLHIRYYEFEYKLQTDTEFIQSEPVSNPAITIFDIAPGEYDFRVRAVDLRDVKSAFSTTSQEIFALTDIPADISEFTMVAAAGQAILGWDPIPFSDLDVRIGGFIEVRHTTIGTGATWEQGTRLGEELDGQSTTVELPLLLGSYMIKAVDSVGNESENEQIIINTVPDPKEHVEIATVTENPTYGGAKTRMYVNQDDDTLRIDGADLFDNSPGLFDDAIGEFDAGNNFNYETSGLYSFLNKLDLGVVKPVRLTVEVEFVIFDGTTEFDEADGLFDDREGLFDGENIGDMLVELFVRETPDDPNGSPVFTDFKKLNGVGDFVNRGFDFKLNVTSPKNSNQIKITKLIIHASVPIRTEDHLDELIVVAGETITWDIPFELKPSVTVNLQDAQQADTIIFTHNTSGGKFTGIDIQILNLPPSGPQIPIGVERTADIYVRGF